MPDGFLFEDFVKNLIVPKNPINKIKPIKKHKFPIISNDLSKNIKTPKKKQEIPNKTKKIPIFPLSETLNIFKLLN